MTNKLKLQLKEKKIKKLKKSNKRIKKITTNKLKDYKPIKPKYDPTKPPKKPKYDPTKPPKKPRKFKLPKKKFNFNSKLIENRILKVEGLFRERKDPSKPFSKKNIRITKSQYIGTKNEIINKILNKIDRRLIASGEIKILGIGNYKKDKVLQKNLLKKFRLSRNKNTPVLKIVELNKYRLDSKTEKIEIKKLKKLKKKTKIIK